MTDPTSDSHVATASFTKGTRHALRSRQWIGRAIFEASLIVLGLVGALLIDEWRDTRERNQRVRSALESISAELRGNREALDTVIASNEQLMATLRESAKSGTTYQGRILYRAGLTSIAWEAARDAGATSDVPFALLMALGGAYSAQAGYVAEVGVLSTYLYTYDGPQSLRDNPARLAGWLNDLTGRARRVRDRIDESLKVLPAPAAVQPR
jgi:hypothetical protein